MLTHLPHTLSHTSPLPTQLSLPPTHFTTPPPIPLPTAPLTSPYIPTHFPMHSPTDPHLPHSFDYVAELPCDNVAPLSLPGKAR